VPETQCIGSLQGLQEALQRGCLSSWDSLMTADPTATFFQSPSWCVEWYRCYDALYQPLVMTVTSGEQLVGVVPLALERSTRRLTFASDEMSDYRDVVAMPGYRQLVVAGLLRLCRAGNFPTPLQLGPMQPESETLHIALAFSGSLSGLRILARSHSCWRWWFTDNAAVNGLTSKKSVRQPLSHYRRQGAVRLERIETIASWEDIREEFFDQHALRQIYTGRPVSFNDERKRAFYTALLQKHPSAMHVTALRVGERILAMHYGYTWRDVLYWGAPAFDITEVKHSPGQVLLALVFQHAAATGLRGVDLTLGIEDYKKRFSNEHVELPTLEIYARARQYYARRLRDEAASIVKALVVRWRGPQAWDQARDVLDSIGGGGRGVWSLAAGAARRAKSAVTTKSRRLIFMAMPVDVRQVTPHLLAGENVECRNNRVTDLLKWEHGDRKTASRIAVTVRRVPESLRSGHTLHTLLLNDRLVGWGWSYLPRERVLLLDTKTSFDVEANAVWLYDFYLVPMGRHRQEHQAALLARIVEERVVQGAERAYIVSTGGDVLLRRAIEQVGFHLVRVDKLVRVLRRERRTIKCYAGTDRPGGVPVGQRAS